MSNTHAVGHLQSLCKILANFESYINSGPRIEMFQNVQFSITFSKLDRFWQDALQSCDKATAAIMTKQAVQIGIVIEQACE